MADEFRACSVPWAIWPWGLTLTHSDTDVDPECTVAFGARIAAAAGVEERWVQLEFSHAALVLAKPHRDDELLTDVTGYSLPDRRSLRNADTMDWLQTGICADPGIYFATTSTWLAAEQSAWLHRQRATLAPGDAVHFVLDGRDGYVEILASGFRWSAWIPGKPRLNEVSGQPTDAGTWSRPLGSVCKQPDQSGEL